MHLELGEPNPREIARSTCEGNPSLSSDDMEACYAYVNLLARGIAGRCFEIKLDPEDLAHEAIIRVQARWQQLKSSDPVVIKAWLRTVVSNVLHDLADKAWAGKRDIGKERSLDAALDESSAKIEVFLPANTATPSKMAVRHERALALAQALGRLPEDQRVAIELHHLSGFSLDQTARQMDRSFTSVAGLLRRGLTNLREHCATLDTCA